MSMSWVLTGIFSNISITSGGTEVFRLTTPHRHSSHL
jgi:hypothetical protein